MKRLSLATLVSLPMREVQARVEAVDLRRLLGKPSLPGPLRYVSWLRWTCGKVER